MTVADFFNSHELTEASLRECAEKTYTLKDQQTGVDIPTDVKVKYIRISPDLDGQSFLVLSYNAAQHCGKDKSKIRACQMVRDEKYGWGIIMPDTSKELLNLLA